MSVDKFGRHICTKEEPWTKEIGGLAVHPEAYHSGTCYEGCCDDFKCPVCGVEWREELPQ